MMVKRMFDRCKTYATNEQWRNMADLKREMKELRSKMKVELQGYAFQAEKLDRALRIMDGESVEHCMVVEELLDANEEDDVPYISMGEEDGYKGKARVTYRQGFLLGFQTALREKHSNEEKTDK
jgi:hypothetical protein|tara:strand:+ start:2100 stop:2471 length:372 start_codon:yes stop_codon:yes gene_type:complete